MDTKLMTKDLRPFYAVKKVLGPEQGIWLNERLEINGRTVNPFMNRLMTLSENGRYINGHVTVAIEGLCPVSIHVEFDAMATHQIRENLDFHLSDKGPQPGMTINDVCINVPIYAHETRDHFMVYGVMLHEQTIVLKARLHCEYESETILGGSSYEVRNGMTVASSKSIMATKVMTFSAGAQTCKAIISPIGGEQTIFGRRFQTPEQLLIVLLTHVSTQSLLWKTVQIAPKANQQNFLGVSTFLHKVYEGCCKGRGVPVSIPAPYWNGEQYTETFYEEAFQALRVVQNHKVRTTRQPAFDEPIFDFPTTVPTELVWDFLP